MDVEPVRVIGSKLLVGASLDNVDPLGDLELTSALEIGGIGLDKFYFLEIKELALTGRQIGKNNFGEVGSK